MNCRGFIGVGVVVATLWAYAGCGAGVDDDLDGTGGSGNAGGGNTGGSGAAGGGFVDGGGPPGDCASGELECAADLHTILCDGEVIGTCGESEGCAGGTCIPACDAARENKSSVGCDYYAVNPDVLWSQGACYAAFVANTWTTPVTITVERDGAPLDVTAFGRIPSGSGTSISYQPLPNGQLPPGQVAVLFLAQFNPGASYTPPCPPGVTAALESQDAALHDTGIASSFHITTSVPIVAYDIFPYGGGPSAITSATLLLPTSSWDTNYVAVQPYGQTIPGNVYGYHWLQIVATEDATSVTISPTAAIVGSATVLPTGQGVPATYMINRGQVLQFTQDEPLNGSPIQSDKPIGLIGGNRCMVIPAGASACDAGHQMIPPVRALGNEYIGVHHRNRFAGIEETPPWRIVGAVDGTTLTYEPSPPAGAPTTIGVGQVAEFSTSAPFVVRSQDADHPFYMSGHMTGCTMVSTDTFGDCRGDPETVNVIPTEQYLDQYVFFTDPTYPETNLIIVRKKGDDGAFHDVTLDCLAAPISGWQPVGSGQTYEYASIDLVTGNFQPVNGCDNGRREATSDAPFAITVWGWGSGATGGDPAALAFPYSQYVSYAYPAGASVQPISDVVVPPAPR